MNKVFSIITPTFNAEEKIGKTIQSVILQKSELYEYIIVDGASNDTTVKIIDEYQRKLPQNIKYISESDSGIYDAMNKGIDLAEGEYLYFLGAGDTLRPGVLEQVSPKLKYDNEFIYGNTFFEKSERIVSGKFSKHKISVWNICHQSIFYRNKLFDIIGKYDLRYRVYSDAELNLRCFGNKNIKKRYINLVIADYEEDGLSDLSKDHNFGEDLEQIISKNLGSKYRSYYKDSGKEFLDFIRHFNNKEVVIYGTDSVSIDALKHIEESNKKFNSNIRIKYFLSSNLNKWDREFLGMPVKKPEYGLPQQVDKVIVATYEKHYAIRQLLKLGFEKDSIIIANELIYDYTFFKYLKNQKGRNIIIFGIGSGGEKVYNRLCYFSERFKCQIKIKSFMDNNPSKWNTEFCTKRVLKPEAGNISKDDIIVIASSWRIEITEQLIEMGVEQKNILSAQY